MVQTQERRLVHTIAPSSDSISLALPVIAFRIVLASERLHQARLLASLRRKPALRMSSTEADKTEERHQRRQEKKDRKQQGERRNADSGSRGGRGGGGRGGGSAKLRGLPKDSHDVRISKTLSWILRHGSQSEGLAMRPDGYVRVDELVSLGRAPCDCGKGLMSLEVAGPPQAAGARLRHTRGDREG